MAVGRSLDLQPLQRLNPLHFHKISVWRHRIHHGYHSSVACCAAVAARAGGASGRRKVVVCGRYVIGGVGIDHEGLVPVKAGWWVVDPSSHVRLVLEGISWSI